MEVKGNMDLVIDASMMGISLGVFEGEALLYGKRDRKMRGEEFDAMVEEALSQSGKNISELESILITTGPGSFTGLRVGLAYAQGLCFTGKVKLYGISTLAAFALMTEKSQACAVVYKAKPGLYYCGIKEANQAIGAHLDQEFLVHEEELQTKIPKESVLVADLTNEAELLKKTGLSEAVTFYDDEDELTFLKKMKSKMHDLSPFEKLYDVEPNYIQEPNVKKKS